jgi:ABC-2 type transport system permease protein
MRGFRALLKKEVREQMRTHRLLIVAAVFVVFGMATPLLLKFLPQLLELAGEGMEITLPPPTAATVFGEYASTMLQVGVLVAVLMAMGSIARERERGLAAMILSKPVGLGAYILAKLTAVSGSFAVAMAAGGAGCYYYTTALIEPANASAFVGLNLLLALFLVFCLSVTMLLSSLFRNQLAAGGIALAVLIGQALLAQVPIVGEYVPGQLAGWGTGMLSGPHPTAWPAVGVTVALTAACLFGARVALRRREL